MAGNESAVIPENLEVNPCARDVKVRHRGQRGMGHVYEHHRNWRLDVNVHGERYRLNLGPVKALDKREARKIADERVRQLLMPQPPAAKGELPFRQSAQRFMDHYVQTRSSWAKHRGKKLERTQLQHAVRFFADTPLREITPALVEDFRASLGQRKVASSAGAR